MNPLDFEDYGIMAENYVPTQYSVINWIMGLIAAFILAAGGLIVHNIQVTQSDLKDYAHRIDLRSAKTEVDLAALKEITVHSLKSVEDLEKSHMRLGVIEEKVITIDRRLQIVIDKLMALPSH